MDNFVEIDRKLTAWIDSYSGDLVETTQELLRIPSVKGQPALDAPFGMETAQALRYALGKAAQYGLEIKNLDGYAGHAEWRAANVASHAEIVGVLAHVDVVPAGDGWVHPAFGGEVDKGILYSRGAIDDKGPAMAGLFAILAVAACDVPATKRIRLILGADEESGFGCVAHYFANEEMPATGFTPDGRFPVIHAEKGIANLEVTLAGPLVVGGLKLVSLNAGRRANMVPDLAEAVLEGTSEQIESLSKAVSGNNRISIETLKAGQVKISARGVSAHGSTPEEGVNAFVVLCDALRESGIALSSELETAHAWAADITGGALGIAGRDDIAGELTSNLGIAAYDGEQLKLTFNIRYPVTWTVQDVLAKAEPVVRDAGARISGHVDQKPLYVPLDDPLLETLLSVYRSETGDHTPARTMGGGTYARVMRKGVAFGPEFVGTSGGAHQPEEQWPVEHLIRATKIYARALARLVA